MWAAMENIRNLIANNDEEFKSMLTNIETLQLTHGIRLNRGAMSYQMRGDFARTASSGPKADQNSHR